MQQVWTMPVFFLNRYWNESDIACYKEIQEFLYLHRIYNSNGFSMSFYDTKINKKNAFKSYSFQFNLRQFSS